MNNDFEYITSIKNPKVQHVKKLKDRSYRRRSGEYVVEGENFVKDVPKDAEITAIYLQKDKLDKLGYIVEGLGCKDVYLVDEKVMTAISDTVTPSGILATLKIPKCDGKILGNAVVLDRVSDPGNMGTIIRTCSACGIENIVAIDCVDYLSPKVIRASMGGIFSVKVVEKSLPEALELLQNHNLYALDMNGENLYSMDVVLTPFALVVGNESKGLSQDIRDRCKIISLPMSGKIESLNAAVSLSTALYEIVFGKNIK